eukprot:TRINITY_DN1553_c0_g1_i5.p1 TRINITY_DN1553_c0_g1~~TRINITY_DN1553_c0_g1_i5.p1  ORF type:complete len:700 (-),score=177.17 TRINITY_DN1553_c0_g1_i5:30-2129(-)
MQAPADSTETPTSPRGDGGASLEESLKLPALENLKVDGESLDVLKTPPPSVTLQKALANVQKAETPSKRNTLKSTQMANLAHSRDVKRAKKQAFSRLNSLSSRELSLLKLGIREKEAELLTGVEGDVSIPGLSLSDPTASASTTSTTNSNNSNNNNRPLTTSSSSPAGSLVFRQDLETKLGSQKKHPMVKSRSSGELQRTDQPKLKGERLSPRGDNSTTTTTSNNSSSSNNSTTTTPQLPHRKSRSRGESGDDETETSSKIRRVRSSEKVNQLVYKLDDDDPYPPRPLQQPATQEPSDQSEPQQQQPPPTPPKGQLKRKENLGSAKRNTSSPKKEPVSSDSAAAEDPDTKKTSNGGGRGAPKRRASVWNEKIAPSSQSGAVGNAASDTKSGKKKREPVLTLVAVKDAEFAWEPFCEGVCHLFGSNCPSSPYYRLQFMEQLVEEYQAAKALEVGGKLKGDSIQGRGTLLLQESEAIFHKPLSGLSCHQDLARLIRGYQVSQSFMEGGVKSPPTVLCGPFLPSVSRKESIATLLLTLAVALGEEETTGHAIRKHLDRCVPNEEDLADPTGLGVLFSLHLGEESKVVRVMKAGTQGVVAPCITHFKSSLGALTFNAARGGWEVCVEIAPEEVIVLHRKREKATPDALDKYGEFNLEWAIELVFDRQMTTMKYVRPILLGAQGSAKAKKAITKGFKLLLQSRV